LQARSEQSPIWPQTKKYQVVAAQSTGFITPIQNLFRTGPFSGKKRIVVILILIPNFVIETALRKLRTSTMSRGLFWKPVQSKLLVLLALKVTSTVTFIIMALSTSHSYSTRYLATLQKNRAPVQVIVHIISATLGSLQIYVLSSLIKFRANIRLCKEPTSLDELKLHKALNSGKLDFDLPRLSLFGVLAYVAVIQIPAAIWAGAITPVIISASSPAIYHIPFYNPSTINNWAVTCRPATKCANTAAITTDRGTFTNIAWKR